MIHIILTLLKVIGILILILLGLLLSAILALLFIPVRYRARIKKNTEVFEGKADISWLAWILWVQVSYKNRRPDLNIRIFGIPIRHLKKLKDLIWKVVRPIIHFFKKLIPGRQGRRAGETAGGVLKEPEIDNTKAQKSNTEAQKNTNANKSNMEAQKTSSAAEFFVKIRSLPAAIKRFFGKTSLTIRTLYGRIKHWKRFLTGEALKGALNFLFGSGKSLFRHIRPRKMKGSIKFGFDDPAATGQLLAAISVIYPLYRKLTVIPVFEEQIFEVDVILRGRIRGCVLIKIAWEIYRNQHVKATIKEFQRKEA